ncbi:MAG: UDP-glucose 4-epimerase GalE, partial [Rhodospirillales bacterium]|nr:UDP-glucose 4-epimerase GalE [Rhodospirillales bacterium]
MTDRRDALLVTGGAGFVGSHVVGELAARGHRVVVADNLRTGHRAAVPDAIEFHQLDLADAAGVERLFRQHRFTGVLHFAALSLVGESMQQPLMYLGDNTINGLNLLKACAQHGVKRFVLSSTAALFDQGGDKPIDESTPIVPGNPYGESKYFIERMLHWADQTLGIRSACLRYFNAAGAHPSGDNGEDHRPETHLIPLVIQAALGRRPEITVFGEDYPTPDGTGIRDYIHVLDLADA